jgi:prolyl oligopeptidase
MVRNFDYPETRRDESVVDNYHGTPVPDPYRWLEDPDAEETQAWVQAQNTLTRDYLSEISAWTSIEQRLTRLYDFPRFEGTPGRYGDRYFFRKNDGLQNQSVLYGQQGLDGETQALLDPNTLSDDGTIALMQTHFNKDGSRMVYSLSSGGSDWQTLRVRDVVTSEDYPETLDYVKFAGVAWHEDGFFYNRYPEPGPGNEQGNLHNQVYYHRLNTAQAEDTLVYARPDAPELAFNPFMTDDGAYLMLHVWHGAINRNRIYYRPADSDGEFIRLLDDADAEYGFAGNAGATFFFYTDLDAPKGRIITIDDSMREIVPEGDGVIEQATIINGQLVLNVLENANHKLKIYDLDGAYVQDVPLPGPGTVAALSGKQDHTQMFFSFQSYLYPPTIFQYDFETGEVTVWGKAGVVFDADAYVTEQVWYPSKDGTQVSMFITHKKGLALTGDHPTILYGYGGFSISLTPGFAPHILNWLEMGGIYAVANLRGGSEYGEAWHQAGMLANKQNVFDDFIAAAEWLIDNQYTKTERLVIMGGSNGGLLVSACMVQRPDLFGAVICQVPVTDMLRYHRFTAGRYWTPEYGNAEEDPEHFNFLIAYSPLHNVQPGATYPPILILTADHDDRVVPMHAEKFAATIQAADSGANPLLLRFDLRSGHGMGKPTSKIIDQWADIQAFLVRNLGMD